MAILELDAEVPNIDHLLHMPLVELTPIVLEIARSRAKDGKFRAHELLQKTIATTVGRDPQGQVYGGARAEEVATTVDRALHRLEAAGDIVQAYTEGGSIGYFRVMG
ncbi:MAG TPA: hypothetical protein VNU19_13595 [Candidatus Acidoferrum sp.]|nr:hypothetical protein [Candidatus Acidoferrum sp.]